MPKLRLFGATNTRLADEYMTLPATSISPELGRSSPAIERKVVVLPQPEGPSSVNSLPSGTSKLTSWAALTTVPRSPGYSVNSDLTLSTFVPVCCPRRCRNYLPSPLWGGVGGGGREMRHFGASWHDPPPQPSPTQSRVYPTLPSNVIEVG